MGPLKRLRTAYAIVERMVKGEACSPPSLGEGAPCPYSRTQRSKLQINIINHESLAIMIVLPSPCTAFRSIRSLTRP